MSFRTRRPTLPPVAGDAAPVPVQVDVRGVLRALSLLTGVMIVMGIVSRVASTTTTDFVGRDVLANMFALSGEGNMPTYYSSFLLAMAAAIAWVIARTKRQVNDRFQRAWLAISAVFVYLSVDEVAQIHERVATGVRRIVADSAVLHYAWVAPYALVVLAVIVTFVPFLLHLPRRTAGGMILAGALYVLGAMGLEVFEGVLDFEGHFFSVAMAALVTIEESLEMCSVVLFIGVLLDYLRRQLPDLHLDLSFIGGRSR
ncbi:hypothetical protein HNQ07_002315 [Deinococcus metalli]|uniref:Uncharacterized protein n=1 Tax=Deinococcus metalli TaxID=1141878 RepID=A0A7W8NPK1_9DEIO|nr:hypothetical protein [Deinococcus metalli]MBB5376851.1 hypothetical protein [Deinococcus metalli]